MLIHIEIAGALQLEIETAVPREALQHVVEEANAGRDAVLACAVDIQTQRNFRLQRVALNRRDACNARRLWHCSDLFEDVAHRFSFYRPRTRRASRVRAAI